MVTIQHRAPATVIARQGRATVVVEAKRSAASVRVMRPVTSVIYGEGGDIPTDLLAQYILLSN
jgi:hypothetical protein